LLKELGEKLVETVHLALSELVKNSYDADASKVNVIIDQNDKGENRVQIIDDGRGMNFDQIEKYWMRIATTNKVKDDVSPHFGRPLTGAKGIGRFSCRRLGHKLTLITNGTSRGKKTGKAKNIQFTKVVFPWDSFTPGTDVTSISCKGEQEILKQGETGTTLIIEGGPDEWGNKGINWLKRQLAVLSANRGAKREGFNDDPGFEVFLSANDFEGGVRDLRTDFINAGWGTLKAFVNKKGQAVCELNAIGLGRRTITSSIKFPNLKDVSLELGIMVDVRSQMRDRSIISKGTLEKILPEWGGVQIRYRNFRVYPYGDDDWLNIDYDRGLRRAAPKNELHVFAESLQGVDASRSLLNMMSMRSYVGNVIIGDSAIGFEMKANREGFISSDAFNDLIKFVRFSIDWTTILRDYFIRLESLRIFDESRSILEEALGEKIERTNVVEKAVNHIGEAINTISGRLTIKEKEKLNESFDIASTTLKTYNDSISIELAHLRLIASTTTLLLIFSHEVKSLLGFLEQSKNSLKRVSKILEGKHKDSLLVIADNIFELNKRLEDLLKMTSSINSQKINANPENLALKQRIVKVEKVFSLITSKYNIEIDYTEVANSIVIKNILEAELYSILLNVFSNSIKAVIAKGGDKKIKIKAFIVEGRVSINFFDNGIGLKADRFNEVFTPFVSDPDGRLYENLTKRINPEDNIIVGSGSGLGLGIVKEIINAHQGKIEFKNPFKRWSTHLEIII